MTTRASLYQARYGSSDVAVPAAGSTLIDHLLAHRSVRAYLPDPVNDDQLAAIVAAAQSAASSSNLHAWSVVAVRDPARKARLAVLAGDQPHIRQAPLLLVWLADLARLEQVAQKVGEEHVALDYLEMFEVGVIDAALAAQNAVSAAESLGLGTVYIGAMRNHPEDVATELGLPDHAFAVFGLCVGRPDPARPAAVKPRLDPAVVLHRETYEGVAPREPAQAPEGGEREAIARYDRVMRDFQASQAMPATDWSAQASGRVKGPETLSGRDRLKTALAALGFPLA